MSPLRYDITLERDVPMRMRDDVVLYSDIYRPRGDGPFPVILMRLPYDKTAAETSPYAHPSWYARHGYIVVIQDCRGRWKSEGEWYPFFNEGPDGYDTVQQMAQLPGSNGKVGMYGASYPGATQLFAATEQAPGLTCICPAIPPTDFYQACFYEGGALHLALAANWSMFVATDSARRVGRADIHQQLGNAGRNSHDWYWHLPLNEFPPLLDSDLAPFWFDWLQHSRDDEYWQTINLMRRLDKVQVPALHIGGWYDIFVDTTLKSYAKIASEGDGEAARNGQRLIVGPWYHHPWSPQVGEVNFGPSASSQIVDDTQVRFYDQHLKGVDDGIGQEPPVMLFVMGENRWRDEQEWPLKRAVATPYYFHSAGNANSMFGDGTLAPVPPQEEPYDVYVYDPRSPSISRGGHSCCFESLVPQGAYDQRPVEVWKDTLCYTSEPLDAPLEVTGHVTVALWAATSAVDTDWVAKLVDVYPDGRAINLTEGILRARFRGGFAQEQLLERDEIYQYEINLRATSNVFLPGHRIRVDVSSSSFPHWDRNPNSGQPMGTATVLDVQTATQTVFHDRARPSHIVLPVVPRR